MQQVDVCDLLEHFAGKMLGGGKAGAGEHDLAGMVLGVGHQLLHVVGGEIRTRHDHQAGGGNLPNRREGRVGVVGHVLLGDGGDDLTRGHDSERVAVGRRLGDHVIAQDAARTRLVFDDERLAEPALHRVGENAADDVGAAARPE